jgi:hypothetical protein
MEGFKFWAKYAEMLRRQFFEKISILIESNNALTEKRNFNKHGYSTACK